MTHFTMPERYFCPTCGIHNRFYSIFRGVHKLAAECPVCADKRQRGEAVTA